MISYLLKHPTGTLMGCLCLVVMGLVVLFTMPINLYPQAQFPVLTINTVLSDSSPEEIETIITKPIEEAVSEISGLRKIQSVSRFGESEITLQFHYGGEIREKALEVRSRIRRLIPSFPKDARFPTITQYNPSDLPVMVIAVIPKTSPELAGEWVQQTLRPLLTRMDGVASIRVSGAPRRQITVDCDPGRLNAHQLTIQDVAESIKEGHQALPAGFTSLGDKRLAVTTEGKLLSISEIEQQPLSGPKTKLPVRVGQVAEVKQGSEQPREITRYNGESLITVSVYRSAMADLRRISLEAGKVLEQCRKEHEDAPVIRIITDQGRELDKTLERLAIILILTAIITAAVLFFFLGNFLTTLIVLSSIPLAMLLTILFMWLFGVSLDLLSLGGLTLGLGILVDNAIVVVESVCRRWSSGLDLEQGIIRGNNDVMAPLIMSTLTTVIVFIPVVFFSKEIRLLFSGFSLTVALSLIASLLASLVLAPVLMKVVGNHYDLVSQRTFIDFSVLTEKYGQILRSLNAHSWPILCGAAIFLGFAVFLAQGLSFRQTLPSEDQRFRIAMVLPPGTSRDTTAAEAEKVEKILQELKLLKDVHSEIHGNQANFTISVRSPQWHENVEQIDTVTLRKSLAPLQGIQFHVVPLGSRSNETRISMTINGPDIDRLESLQNGIVGSLRKVPGILDVIVMQSNPAPVVEFSVRHESVGFLGFDAKDMAYHLRSHLTGPVAAKMIEGEKQVSIRVRAKRMPEEGLESVQHGIIPGRHGQSAPFLQLGKPSVRLAKNELNRENRRPALKLNLVLDSSDPLKVSENIKGNLDTVLKNTGCDYSFGDEIRNISKTRTEMRGSIGAGLALIYLVLVVATESLSLPLLILTAAPLGLAGSVMALMASGTVVTLPVYIGIMVLCGLIVNVNVVMTYNVNRLIREGENTYTAVMEGAKQRLRAIVMTVLTTVLAMLPMLLDRGSGSSLWSPFAVTLAPGVVCGAMFSLLITPTLYLKLVRMPR